MTRRRHGNRGNPDSLRRATEVKQRRAQLKRDLYAGRVAFTELLRDPPQWAAGMEIATVLLALPRIWERKAARAMVAAGVSPVLPIEQLTHRQYLALLDYFRERHPGIWGFWSATGVLDAQVRGRPLEAERLMA